MFITTIDRSYLRMLVELILLAVAIFAIGSLFAHAQDSKPGPRTVQIGLTTATTDTPLVREYNGVSLGMTAQEARGKLGEPTDKSAEQDFYIISETETAQVFYDSSQKVRAISVHYVGNAGAPTPKSLFGEDVEPRADGSVYKVVRYQSAGYWVSYSRTAGDPPITSVSMQKSP